MQVTVQVNCSFSQCDVFIRGFFSYHYEGWHLCGPICSVILKPIFQLKNVMSIHQIIYFDVYVSETWVKTIYSHFCIFFYVVKNKIVIL